MFKLCLIASHGYPPGAGIVCHPEQNRVVKDCQPYLLCQGGRQSITRLNSLNLGSHCLKQPWQPTNGLCERNQFADIDPIIRTPVLIDVQDTRPDSVLFSFGIVEQCKRHEKILQFLISGSSALERGELDLSLLFDLMGLQVHAQPYVPLIYPSGKFDAPKPLADFVGDLASGSKIIVQPDGRVLLTGSGKELQDVLPIVSEFYSSKNSTMRRKQSMLVPQFTRFDTSEVQADIFSCSSNVKTLTATPLKSPEKIKLKPTPKKKSSRKVGRERDLYEKNYFHACESLLFLMMGKNKRGRTAILSLKTSGPEVPGLLTQFSAGIAGTGLALVFSVICKVACGRVPFCASKLFSTGFGFGLVWLSWAVNKLKETIVDISKKARKVGIKDEEMMSSVDKRLDEIYFSAATLMAVAVLRLV